MSSSGVQGQIRARNMLPEDLDRVLEITSRSPGAAQWTKKMFDGTRGAGELAWVVEAGGQVAGFLIARHVTDQGEILNLAVDPPSRRKGLAKTLLHNALKELNSAGTREIFLEVRKTNSAAIAFYAGMGFRISGRRPGYYHEPEEAAVCMKKKLTDQNQVPT